MYGPPLDVHMDVWRRKYNTELLDILEMGTINNYIKRQRKAFFMLFDYVEIN